jgi:hypothetical protein
LSLCVADRTPSPVIGTTHGAWADSRDAPSRLQCLINGIFGMWLFARRPPTRCATIDGKSKASPMKLTVVILLKGRPVENYGHNAYISSAGLRRRILARGECLSFPIYLLKRSITYAKTINPFGTLVARSCALLPLVQRSTS